MIKSIIQSDEPVHLLLRYFIFLIIVLLASVTLINSVKSLSIQYVYRKDFIQEYLLAKAVLNNIDPYLSCPELARRVHLNLPNPIHLHPTPHPPPVIVLALPFGFLPYQQAASFWLLFEISCIILSAYLLSSLWIHKGQRENRFGSTLCISLLMLAWTPFQEELILGQLTSMLLLTLTGAWLALRQDKDLKGGIFLGCVLCIKPIAWPIIAFLALKRRWRAVLSAAAVMGLANLASIWFIGLEQVANYYLKVGPAVSIFHRAAEKNLSVWTIGWRLFEGTGSLVSLGVSAPPLLHAPELARWVSLALPLAVLFIGLALSLQGRCLDFSFGILVCVSILISPVAWSPYFMLLAIPLLIAGRRLFDLAFPTRESLLVIAAFLIFSIPHDTLHNFLLWFASVPQDGKAVDEPHVSFWVGILALTPTAGLLVLTWVLGRLNQKCPRVGD